MPERFIPAASVFVQSSCGKISNTAAKPEKPMYGSTGASRVNWKNKAFPSQEKLIASDPIPVDQAHI